MRVAIVNLHRGGMMHYAAGLARSLLAAEPRTAISVHCPREADLCVLDPRVEVFQYDVPQRLSLRALGGLLGISRVAARVRRDVVALGPDLVHFNSGHVANPFLVPPLAQRFPMVASIHDIRPHPGDWRPVEWLKVPSLLRSARMLVVHGRSLREEALRYWRVHPDRVVALNLMMGRLPGSDGADTQPREGTLLMFGRLLRYKGYDLLSDALALAAPKVPHLRLTVAGTGDRKVLRTLTDRHPAIVQVHEGYMPDAGIAPLFRESCAAVLPYIEASQSGIVHVAAAFSRPVIVTRTGAIPEIVEHGRTGLLATPDDAGALADAILEMLDDPVRSAAMGAAAHAALASHERYVENGARLLEVYARAVSGAP